MLQQQQNPTKITVRGRASALKFDWLTVTFKADPKAVIACNSSGWIYLNKLKEALFLDQFKWVHMRSGINKYEHSEMGVDQASIITGYNDELKVGSTVMFQMSGRGVDAFQSTFDDLGLSWSYLIDKIRRLNGSFTRVDIASDFYNYPRYFSPMYINQQTKTCHMVSTARSAKYIESYSIANGMTSSDYASGDNGSTFYAGRNPMQLRIYNKKAERNAKYGLIANVRSWYRWEFQLNHDKAESFMLDFERRNYDLKSTWVNWLVTNYRWIDMSGTKQVHRTRYPNQKWYQDTFIDDNAENFKPILTRENSTPSLKKSTKWVDKQVKKTLATIFQANKLTYMAHGFSEEDATLSACKYIGSYLEEDLVNGNFYQSAVTEFLVENGLDSNLQRITSSLVNEDYPAGSEDILKERAFKKTQKEIQIKLERFRGGY